MRLNEAHVLFLGYTICMGLAVGVVAVVVAFSGCAHSPEVVDVDGAVIAPPGPPMIVPPNVEPGKIPADNEVR
jgi:hypothetical protein